MNDLPAELTGLDKALGNTLEDVLGDEPSTEFFGNLSITAGESLCARTIDIKPPKLMLQLKIIRNKNDCHLLLLNRF